jgi:hypothetical protein
MTGGMAGGMTRGMARGVTGVMARGIAGAHAARTGLIGGEAALETGSGSHEALVAGGELRGKSDVGIDRGVPVYVAVGGPIPVMGQAFVLLGFFFRLQFPAVVFLGRLKVAVPNFLLQLREHGFEEIREKGGKNGALDVEGLEEKLFVFAFRLPGRFKPSSMTATARASGISKSSAASRG